MDQLPRLGKRELICPLLFICNYVVFVWRSFLFLWVLGIGYIILLWHYLSLPYNYFSNTKRMLFFLAHLSQRLIGELIGYPWSGVRGSSSWSSWSSSTISNIFSSETASPIKAKFYNQSQILYGASLGERKFI